MLIVLSSPAAVAPNDVPRADIVAALITARANGFQVAVVSFSGGLSKLEAERAAGRGITSEFGWPQPGHG